MLSHPGATNIRGIGTCSDTWTYTIAADEQPTRDMFLFTPSLSRALDLPHLLSP